MANDRRQMTGSTVSRTPSSCPAPLSGQTGAAHCAVWCTSSCPQLHPDVKAAARATIDHINKTLPYVDSAIDVAAAALAPQLTYIQVRGAVLFSLPENSTIAVGNAVVELIHAQLPLISPFSINFTVRDEIFHLPSAQDGVMKRIKIEIMKR